MSTHNHASGTEKVALTAADTRMDIAQTVMIAETARRTSVEVGIYYSSAVQL